MADTGYPQGILVFTTLVFMVNIHGQFLATRENENYR